MEFAKGQKLVHARYFNLTKKYSDQRCDFLQKSYRDYKKVEQPVLVAACYEGSDEKYELEAVPAG